MRQCRLLGWCVVVACVWLAHAAGAQGTRQPCPAGRLCPDGDRFVERFDGVAPVRVSGNPVAGISLGSEGGAFRPAYIAVALPAPPSDGRLCLGVTSRDGRYSAENLYRVDRTPREIAWFHFPTGHLDEIAKYRPNDVAILIRVVESCAVEVLGTILPSVDLTVVRRDRLRVFLNAPPERTSVRLLAGDLEIGRSERCQADRERTSLAFAAMCVVPLPAGPLHGPHRLEVTVRERMARDVSRIDLLLELP